MNYSNFWSFFKITEISAFFTSMGLVSIHILLLSMTDISEISEISLKLPKFPLSFAPRSSIYVYHYYYQSLKFPKFPPFFSPRSSIYIDHYYYRWLRNFRNYLEISEALCRECLDCLCDLCVISEFGWEILENTLYFNVTY